MCAHLKRYMKPSTWKLPVKTHYWATTPSPGPHSSKRSVPLLITIRDLLGIADTAKEARSIISSGKILVDGKIVKDYKYPLGFMDVLTIKDTDTHYRILLDDHGRLIPYDIPKENSNWKLLMIKNKTMVRGGMIQLNFHDGKNILTSDTSFMTGDVVKISLKNNTIDDVFKFEEGNVVYVTGGKHAGKISNIEGIYETGLYHKKVVKLKGFETVKDYVFMIGDDKPVISLPGVLE